MGKDNKRLLSKIRFEILHGDALRLFQEEYFALDIIRILYEDNVDEKEKIQLLILLQEYGGLGLELSSVDQIITSLVDICRQYLHQVPKSSFLSQLILTATSLTLQFNLVKSDFPLCDMLIDLLLPLVKKVDDTANLQLRGIACSCLEEMESFCPGLLKKYLTPILKTAQLESTYMYQDIVSLLSRIIHHIITKQNVLETKVNQHPRHSIDEPPSPDEQSLLNMEVKQFVSLVMDNYTPFTAACLWNLVNTIVTVVKTGWETPPSIFKSLALQYVSTFDSSLFLMVVYLKMEFPRQILLNSEEILLNKRFVMASLHPAHSVSQRHMMLSCLADYIEYNEREESKFSVMNSVPIVASRQLTDLNPTAFDDISIQMKKVLILNKCLPPALDSDNSFLLTNLQTMKQLSQSTDDPHAVVSLYSCLFHFYCRHHTSRLGANIQNMMLELVCSNSKFIPYTLDFLMQVEKDVPDSSIYLYLLEELQKMVTSVEMANITEDLLYNYLDVLKLTANDGRIPPLATIRFLHISVLRSLMLDKLSWSLATAVLEVCRNILLHHTTQNIVTEMDSFLNLLMTSSKDVDIIDRATFYYSLLNGAADIKIREVLNCADIMTTRRQLTNIIHSPSTPSNPALIVTMDKPFMQWRRVSFQPVWKEWSSGTEDINTDSKEDLSDQDIFERYMKLIATEDSTYFLTEYQLIMTPQCTLDEVRAITITIDVDDNFASIPAIHIPYLKKDDSEMVQLKFKPRKPFPGDYSTGSIFGSVNKITMYCSLGVTSISFTDLMMPIPWDILGVSHDACKHVLFNKIWDHITESNNNSDPTALQSIKILSVDQTGMRKFEESLLHPYITNTTNEALHCAVFLAPHHHLLLKFKFMTDKTAVSILTDYWQILPSVNTFLESLQDGH
ncbi:AP-5 complex subunit beta-1-like [Argonauta hians]